MSVETVNRVHQRMMALACIYSGYPIWTPCHMLPSALKHEPQLRALERDRGYLEKMLCVCLCLYIYEALDLACYVCVCSSLYHSLSDHAELFVTICNLLDINKTKVIASDMKSFRSGHGLESLQHTKCTFWKNGFHHVFLGTHKNSQESTSGPVNAQRKYIYTFFSRDNN